MDISIFLAKVIGFYLLITSSALIIRARTLKLAVVDIMNNSALSFITGIMALVFGILLVVSHNIWVNDWRVIITIIGWIILIKGITRILFPQFTTNLSIHWIESHAAYYSTILFTFLIGLILIYFVYA